MADKKLSAYDVLSEMSGEDLIIALKSLGEGKYQNANVKLSKMPTVPAGSIICFAGTKGTKFDNGGYFYCDGREVSRSEYPDLFDAIGETYGRGDGINTFNIPDFRGCFLRGVGGNSSPVGQKQGDAIRNITGKISVRQGLGSTGAFAEPLCVAQGSIVDHIDMTGEFKHFNHCHSASFDAARVVPTANENRPINFAVHYYIKY